MESDGSQRLHRFFLVFGVAAALLMAGCSAPQTARHDPTQKPARQSDPAAEEAAAENGTENDSGNDSANDSANDPESGPANGAAPETAPPETPAAGRVQLEQRGKRIRAGKSEEPPRIAAGRPRSRAARFSASRKPGPTHGQSRPGVRDTGRNRARIRPRATPRATPRTSVQAPPRRGKAAPTTPRRRKAPLARIPFEDYLELAPQLEGVASWYGPGFHRKKTASGETYNQYGLTAAHRVLPMGTRLLVENLETGAKVRVRINDRGPYKKGRIIDLSRSAAIRVGMIQKGTAPVRLTIVRWPTGMDPGLGLKAYRQFVVQVGAYPSASKAERQRLDLGARFDQVAFLVDRTSRGLFAIVAGPYDEESAARRVASLLQKSGISNLVRSYRK